MSQNTFKVFLTHCVVH